MSTITNTSNETLHSYVRIFAIIAVFIITIVNDLENYHGGDIILVALIVTIALGGRIIDVFNKTI